MSSWRVNLWISVQNFSSTWINVEDTQHVIVAGFYPPFTPIWAADDDKEKKKLKNSSVSTLRQADPDFEVSSKFTCELTWNRIKNIIRDDPSKWKLSSHMERRRSVSNLIEIVLDIWLIVWWICRDGIVWNPKKKI